MDGLRAGRPYKTFPVRQFTQIYRSTRRGGFSGIQRAPLWHRMYTSLACLYFLPLIEAASRPAGMSGSCRDFVGDLSGRGVSVGHLQGVCQALVGNLSGLIALFVRFGVQGG